MPFKALGSRWRKHLSLGTQFQVVSDLHLEYCCQYTTFCLPAHAPNLILAGNTGRLSDYELYLDFLTNVCSRFKKVFLVMGLLEHQGMTPHEVEYLSIKLQNEVVLRGRLMVLNQSKVSLNANLTVIGSTVFPESESSTANGANENESNFLGITGWSRKENDEARQSQSEWLMGELQALEAEKHRKHRVLVITNGLLELRQLPGTTTDDSSIPTTNSISNMAMYWICGGDSDSTDSAVEGVQVVRNQRGLVTPFEDTNTAYSRESAFGRRGSLMMQSPKRPGFNIQKVIRA